MATFDNLAYELIFQTIEFVTKKADVASLRLVNRRLGGIATEIYFARIPLYPYWRRQGGCYEYLPYPLFLNDIYSYDVPRFKNILDSPDLRKLVRKVDVYPSSPNCDHYPHFAPEMCDCFMRRDQREVIWEECFHRLGEFENLRGVVLHFDRHGSAVGYAEDCFQDNWEKSSRMNKTLNMLGSRIKDLSLRHWEDEHFPMKDPLHFLTNINYFSTLQSLRMSIVHDQVPENNSSANRTYAHKGWSSFPYQWLFPLTRKLDGSPSTPALKHLTLYSDMLVGWFPKLDLREVHFDHLKTLALGHFIFAYDWQFDWIVSHRSTLTELYLDQCSILYQIGHAKPENWFDKDGFPYVDDDDDSWWSLERSDRVEDTVEETGNRFHLAPTFTSYQTRWHDVFDLFTRQLSRLRVFRFGSSKHWDFKTPNRRVAEVGHDMPIMPWESERAIENELFVSRYLHYDDWEDHYGIRWNDKEGDVDWEVEYDEEEQEWLEGMEEPPDCELEDSRALNALLTKLGSQFSVRKLSDPL